MGDMTIFSLYPFDQPALTDTAQVAAAIESADYLSTDLLALDRETGGIVSDYFAFLKGGHLAETLAAKRRLAHWARKPGQWQRHLAETQIRLRSPISRFASAFANIGYISIILFISEMAQITDRLTFAKKAVKLAQNHYQIILNDLLEGKLKPDASLAQRLETLVDIIKQIQATDIQKMGSQEGWRGNEEAAELLHRLYNQAHLLEPLATLTREAGQVSLEDLPVLQRVAADPQSLEGLVRGASLNHLLVLAARKIRLTIDIPGGVILADQRQREILAASLTELITNAIKYADDSKREKWIRVDWDPARRILRVADNGIGIRDTEAIWRGGHREAPAHAAGTGMGLNYMKTQLAAIGWKIRVDSTPGRGTIFKLTAPPGSVSYSEPYVARELAYQREHFRHHKHFDFSRFTPEVLSQMTAEEQVVFTKQLVVEVEATSGQFYDGVRQLEANDLAGWKRLMTSHFETARSLLRFREETRWDSTIADLVNNIFSSVIQLVNGVELYHLVYQRIKSGQLAWEEGIKAIHDPNHRVESHLTSDAQTISYGAPHARVELAEDFIAWLLQNFPKVEGIPQGVRFQGALQSQPEQHSGITPQIWPPDPANDLVLQTYLELLGWRMTVEETGDALIVEVDFSGGTI